MVRGDYAAAKESYEASLALKQEIGGDKRGEAIVNGQLGTLALRQGNLSEATHKYQFALNIFKGMDDSATEAIYWHQLGNVQQQEQRWLVAEQSYRKSAELKELRSNQLGAATSWIGIAIVNQFSGNPQEAEAWYLKAFAIYKAEEDLVGASEVLNNLADLLSQQPDRISEARQLGEEALKIKKTIDLAAAQIWKTYDILAHIANLQQESDMSQSYRRQARQSLAAFAGLRYELQRSLPLITGVVAATTDPEVQQQLEPVLKGIEQKGFGNLVAAIRQILAGERDEEHLFAPRRGIHAEGLLLIDIDPITYRSRVLRAIDSIELFAVK